MKLPKRPKGKGSWSEAAIRVLEERYLAKDEEGRTVETPDDMCWRVAWEIANAERAWGKGNEEIMEIAEKFYDMMIDKLFMPNSPTLMNAGRGTGLQYSACFVLPVGDSMDEIFEAIKRAAIIHKSGGGTGFSFSRLRPKDSIVRTSGGRASGPVSFMKVFDAATDAVKQGGKRRGANMGILRVDHPDILEFIDCKLTGGITNFNISVAATDAFMKAVMEGGEYDLIAQPGWPAKGGGRYKGGEVIGKLPARDVFNRIVKAAWATGDPGLIFIDRINGSPANPVPELWEVEATNPCGEQPLYPNEACNLGSINLSKFVRESEEWPVRNPEEAIEWDRLERVIRLAVRFLDDVIEVNPFPLPEIKEMVKLNRRIGLGVMGWADMLFMLGIPYDSEEAAKLGEKIMGFIEDVGKDESSKLAMERGTFPTWEKSIYREIMPMRNATVTTIAPTGSISIIADCSSGIEPLFALAYEHRVKQPDGEERRISFVNKIFRKKMEGMGFWNERIERKVLEVGRIREIEEIPEDIRRVFVTAHEIAPEWHVRMQAAFQKHTDNAVSKTVNLPNSATVEDVARVYLMAYEEGCKGITVYRDRCREEQVLYAGTGVEKRMAMREVKEEMTGEEKVIPRPRTLRGITYRVETPLGTAFITVNNDEQGDPFEIFCNIGKAGSDTTAVAEAIGRLISLILRLPSSLPPKEKLQQVIDQLQGIGGGRHLGFGPRRVRSLPDAIAQVLSEHLGTAPSIPDEIPQLSLSFDTMEEGTRIGDICPKCGQATFVYEEGCTKCLSCGYTEC